MVFDGVAIMQHDLFVPTLTAQETLWFSKQMAAAGAAAASRLHRQQGCSVEGCVARGSDHCHESSAAQHGDGGTKAAQHDGGAKAAQHGDGLPGVSQLSQHCIAAGTCSLWSGDTQQLMASLGLQHQQHTLVSAGRLVMNSK